MDRHLEALPLQKDFNSTSCEEHITQTGSCSRS